MKAVVKNVLLGLHHIKSSSDADEELKSGAQKMINTLFLKFPDILPSPKA